MKASKIFFSLLVSLCLLCLIFNIIRIRYKLDKDIYKPLNSIEYISEADSLFGKPNYILSSNQVDIESEQKRNVYICSIKMLPITSIKEPIEIYITFDTTTNIILDYIVERY